MVLDPTAPAWEDTALRAGAPPTPPFSKVVKVAPGKFVLLAPNASDPLALDATLVSLVASDRLVLSRAYLPSNARAGLALTPQPVITVSDIAGFRARDSSATAVVSVFAYDAANTGVPISGASVISAVDGTARFTDLSIDSDISSVRLVFTSPALRPSIPSAAFPVVTGPAASIYIVQPPIGVYLSQPFVIQPAAELRDTAGMPQPLRMGANRLFEGGV